MSVPPAGRRRARRAAGARARRRHPHAGLPFRPVRCAVITVSDTRTPARDESGAALARAFERAGHLVVLRGRARDTRAEIRREVRRALGGRTVDVVALTGGTGIARRDVTPEAVAPLVTRWLPGFGELFRAISYREVGAAAWLSRAAAGIARGKLLVLLPGSPAAVRLGADRLLVPEVVHVVRLLARH